MERGHETVLAVLPLFHVYGLTMCLTMNMLAAGTLVLLPTFEALANPLDDNARPGTIGLPVPGTEARIADLDDPSRDVAFGETPAGSACSRPRSRTCSPSTRPCRPARWRACRTRTGARPSRRSSSSATTIRSPPTSCTGSARPAWWPTRCRRCSSSATSCRRTSSARCCAGCCGPSTRPPLAALLDEGPPDETPAAAADTIEMPPAEPDLNSSVAEPRHGHATEPDTADGGLVDELERLARLRDSGALTDDEFHAAKARLLR